MPCSCCGRWEDDWIDWECETCLCVQTALRHIYIRRTRPSIYMSHILARKCFFVCKSCTYSSLVWNVRACPHMASKNEVTILCRWGTRSWLVCFGGKYQNERPPHVAANVDFVGGETFALGLPTLKEIRCKKQTIFVIMRNLVGFSDRYGGSAHVTVCCSRNKPDLATWADD